MLYNTKYMLSLLLVLTPLSVCAQKQDSLQTEQKSALTDSVHRMTEVIAVR